MTLQLWTDRWWEASAIVLALGCAVVGVIATRNGYPGWAIAIGFVPAVMLVAGLALRQRWRRGATVMVTVASLLAVTAWWFIYTVILAVVIIVGGLGSGKIGLRSPKPAAT